MKTAFIVTILCAMVRMAVELIWTTEELYTTSCESQDKLLMWNYSIEENEKVTQFQWFYNKTKLISYYSDFRGFVVQLSYKGRVEQSRTTGIILKNVSALDSGEYSLYPKLAGEHTQNVQTMFLTVYENPTFQCKPVITVHLKNILSCSINSCGQRQLLPEWKLLGERDPVGNQSYLKVNSSWNDELVFCCPQGPSMKCHNGDPLMFCESTSLFSTHEDRHTKEDIPGKNGLSTVKSSNSGDTEDMNLTMRAMMAIILVLLVVTLLTLFAFLHLWWKVRLQSRRVQRSCYIHVIQSQEIQKLSKSFSVLPMRICQEDDGNTTDALVEINDWEYAASDAETVTIHGKKYDKKNIEALTI